MTIQEAIRERHSVRAYQERPLEPETAARLKALINDINRESGLHIQLVTDEPEAFRCFLAKYGSFSGVSNYIAMVGKADERLDELCGYYGEKLVLQAQILGLNTCWVKMSYKLIPGAFEILPGEKVAIVIAVGYGKWSGVAHRSKPMEKLCSVNGQMPDWFRKGMEAVLLAPTAVNQQRFHFSLDGNRVTAKAQFGSCTKIDLGIAKYHFEEGAGRENFSWA